MARLYWFLLTIAILVLQPGPVGVQAEPAHDEDEASEQQFLFFMEEAYTQEAQEVQISLFSYFQDEQQAPGESESYSRWVAGAEIEYGLTDWLQIEFEAPYLHRRVDDDGDEQSETGWGDSEIGVSALLHREGAAWWDATVSVSVEAMIPTGDYRKGLGADRTGWGLAIAASKCLDDVVIHLGAGMEWVNDAKEVEIGDDPDNAETSDLEEFACGAALVHRTTDTLESILELTAEFETERGDDGTEHETEVYLTPGFRYALDDDVEIGLGLPIGLTDDAYDWGLFARIILEH